MRTKPQTQLLLTTISALGALLILTDSEEARADQLGLEIDFGSTRVNDASYDAFDGDGTHGSMNLGVSYAPSALVEGLELVALYQRNLFEGTSHRFDSAMRLNWAQRRLMLGVDWGTMIARVLRPSVRLGAGYSLQSLEVLTSGQPLYDNAHGFTAFGALGLGARIPVSAASDPDQSLVDRVSLGLQAHYGYQFQTEATFDQLRASENAYAEDDPWTRQDVSLGSVNTSGLFWDCGASLHFSF